VTLSKYFKNNGFFYFNDSISYGRSKIDRIGKGLIYCEDEIIPIAWKDLKGNHLMDIYDKISKRRVYYYKEIDNKHYKIKLK
jgi:hypothetical protein